MTVFEDMDDQLTQGFSPAVYPTLDSQEYWGDIGKLAEALAKAQGEFNPVLKSSSNPFFKSKYADLTAVIEATRPALSRNGLSVVQLTAADSGSVTVTTLMLHSSGAGIRSKLTLPADQKGKFDVQTCGSAITYARRFAYQAMVHVAGEDDDDGNGAAGRYKESKEDHSQRVTERVHQVKEGFNQDEPPNALWNAVAKASTPEQLNALLDPVIESGANNLKAALNNKAKALGLVYHRGEERFIPDGDSNVGDVPPEIKDAQAKLAARRTQEAGDDLTQPLQESLEAIQKRHGLKPASQVASKPKSAPKADSAPKAGTLTQPQIAKLWALAGDCGFTEQQTRDLAGRFGHEGSFKEMDKPIYDQIIQELELYVNREAK